MATFLDWWKGGRGKSEGGGGKNIDFWEVISLSPVMMGGWGGGSAKDAT